MVPVVLAVAVAVLALAVALAIGLAIAAWWLRPAAPPPGAGRGPAAQRPPARRAA